MRKAIIATACFVALSLAACSKNDASEDAMTSSSPSDTSSDVASSDPGAAPATPAAASSWPRDAKIIEDNGVTYRVDADGTRVRLGDTDARIVVDNGVRYRLDPGGARVKIDGSGVALDVDTPDVDLAPPTMKVQTN